MEREKRKRRKKIALGQIALLPHGRGREMGIVLLLYDKGQSLI